MKAFSVRNMMDDKLIAVMLLLHFVVHMSQASTLSGLRVSRAVRLTHNRRECNRVDTGGRLLVVRSSDIKLVATDGDQVDFDGSPVTKSEASAVPDPPAGSSAKPATAGRKALLVVIELAAQGVTKAEAIRLVKNNPGRGANELLRLTTAGIGRLEEQLARRAVALAATPSIEAAGKVLCEDGVVRIDRVLSKTTCASLKSHVGKLAASASDVESKRWQIWMGAADNRYVPGSRLRFSEAVCDVLTKGRADVLLPLEDGIVADALRTSASTLQSVLREASRALPSRADAVRGAESAAPERCACTCTCTCTTAPKRCWRSYEIV